MFGDAASRQTTATMTPDERVQPIDFTMLVCTYNRAHDLEDLLNTAVLQRTDGAFTYEIIVVDNNSSDHTRAVVESFRSQHPDRIRYLFEPRQGKSNALNTGLGAMHGRYYAIVDDDFLLPENWLARIASGFMRHPEASFVGGKVLPHWESTPPSWLTRQHWSAVGLADYGDAEFKADREREVCLLACTFRADHARAVGGYNARLGVNAGKIGGVEDLDILQRLWSAGFYGVYLPDVSFQHKVAAHRLTKKYHRRWHRGHGESYASLRDPKLEQARARIGGAPSHLFRSLVVNRVKSWLLRLVDADAAFMAATRADFAAGFINARWHDRRMDGALREGRRHA